MSFYINLVTSFPHTLRANKKIAHHLKLKRLEAFIDDLLVNYFKARKNILYGAKSRPTFIFYLEKVFP